MADTTLAAIQSLVRDLTRSPSQAQLSDATLNERINTFLLYDLPQGLRLFDLKSKFVFWTQPYQSDYKTSDPLTPDNPFTDFKNKYTSVNPPVFCSGYRIAWYQSEAEFYNYWPQVNQIVIAAQGDGINDTFQGTLPFGNSATTPNAGILPGQVTISSVDASNKMLVAADIPTEPFDGTGLLVDPNNGNTIVGQVSYITGNYAVVFPNPPANGANVNTSSVPIQVNRPQAIMFYDNIFTIRPVPDRSYKIEMEAFVLPTELLATSQSPDIKQWWEYIAYGAAKKVLQRRTDIETVAQIEPELQRLQSNVLSKTVIQYSNQRVSTIYSQQSGSWGYNGNFGWGGQS